MGGGGEDTASSIYSDHFSVCVKVWIKCFVWGSYDSYMHGGMPSPLTLLIFSADPLLKTQLYSEDSVCLIASCSKPYL